VVVTVTKRRARGAAVAAAVGALGDPLADGVAAAVVTDDLVNGIDWAATWGVANNALIAAPVSFCGGRDGEANCGDGGEDGECFFHGVLGVRCPQHSTRSPPNYSSPPDFFNGPLNLWQ
jgi:hypothetical protein